MKSFNQLNPAETEVLLAFGVNDSIAYPVDCLTDSSDIAQALITLKNKGLIFGKAPYKLTKKGRQALNSLRSNSIT